MIRFFIKFAKFTYWKTKDIINSAKNGKTFDLFGLRLLTGRQGSGKTICLVKILEDARQLYPKAKIVTNFGYIHQDDAFTSWRQLMDSNYLNGEDGLIVGWDEIQNDFSSTDFKNIPDQFIQMITQQRKQRICIYGTSQVYTRTLKALREQAFIVGECRTFARRWTRCKFYDAFSYAQYAERNDPKMKMRLKCIKKISFIQNDKIRKLYDTYEVIKTMSHKEHINSYHRGVQNE